MEEASFCLGKWLVFPLVQCWVTKQEVPPLLIPRTLRAVWIEHSVSFWPLPTPRTAFLLGKLLGSLYFTPFKETIKMQNKKALVHNLFPWVPASQSPICIWHCSCTWSYLHWLNILTLILTYVYSLSIPVIYWEGNKTISMHFTTAFTYSIITSNKLNSMKANKNVIG